MKHGTRNAYDKHKCRCDDCRGFKAAKDKRRRERLKEIADRNSTSIPHGTANGYSKYVCRCDPCRVAYSQYMAEWDEKNPLGRAGHTKRWRDKVSEELEATAAKRGDVWTGAELEIITTRPDLTGPELARMLKRTLPGVYAAQHRATTDPKWIRVVGTSRSIGWDE